MKLGETRIHVESCESTQTLLDPSMAEGTVAVADVQTAGRGRLGRTWEAPPRSAVLVSVLLRPSADRPLPQLALVAGVAVADALEELTGLSVQIKWPNDVMLRRTKVAGILAEARESAVVVGIGVNVNQTREQLPNRGGSLRTATGLEWDRDAVLDAVLGALGTRYEQWRVGGLDAVYDGLERGWSYKRIRNAAESVCSELNSRVLGLRDLYNQCVSEAVSSGVTQVANPNLSNFHRSKGKSAVLASN